MDPNADILKAGKRYMPAALPADLRRMQLGHCYDNCALQALEHASTRKYRYVEGVARSFKSERYVLHAWLTDGTHAYDPTWRFKVDGDEKEYPFPGEYIGVEMNIWGVSAFMLETEYAGVIANAWRAPALARDVLGAHAEVIHLGRKQTKRRLGIV